MLFFGWFLVVFLSSRFASLLFWPLASPSFKCQFHLERFGNHLGTAGMCDEKGVAPGDCTKKSNRWVGTTPSQDASHHQDYYEPFLVGDPNLNLHLPQESWEGGTTQSIRILAAAREFTKKDSLFGKERHDSLSLHFFPAIPAKTRPNFFVQRQLLSKVHFSKLTLTTYSTRPNGWPFVFCSALPGMVFGAVGSGYNGGPVVASYISPRFLHFTNLYCKSKFFDPQFMPILGPRRATSINFIQQKPVGCFFFLKCKAFTNHINTHF